MPAGSTTTSGRTTLNRHQTQPWVLVLFPLLDCRQSAAHVPTRQQARVAATPAFHAYLAATLNVHADFASLTSVQLCACTGTWLRSSGTPLPRPCSGRPTLRSWRRGSYCAGGCYGIHADMAAARAAGDPQRALQTEAVLSCGAGPRQREREAVLQSCLHPSTTTLIANCDQALLLGVASLYLLHRVRGTRTALTC